MVGAVAGSCFDYECNLLQSAARWLTSDDDVANHFIDDRLYISLLFFGVLGSGTSEFSGAAFH